MCGRFSQSQPAIKYAKALDVELSVAAPESSSSFNIAPGRQVLVFHEQADCVLADKMLWGFVPAWADPKSQKLNNARMETADSKPYFRKAWKNGRCLIPADGWYEWQASLKSKQPYFLYRADKAPLFMAGLYQMHPQLGTTSFAVLTTEADGELRQVHDRKPVVLSSDLAREWVKPSLESDQIAAIAYASLAADCFAWHKVSPQVNNARNDGEHLTQTTELN